MSGERSIRDIPTPLLKAMRDVCPSKRGESVTFSALGKSVTLTVESRIKADAELKRRREQRAEEAGR